MKNLKTLIIKNGHFSRSPKHLPNSLRVLEWWRYPAKCFPHDFHPKKLGMLKLPDFLHTIRELDSLSKTSGLVTLKVLNFDYSEFLKELPDMSSLQTLQELSFKNCENLVRVDSSVGFLPKLKILNAFDCEKLSCFPPAINLPSLETLELSGCGSLENFPEILQEMKNVSRLELNGTGIKDLPCSCRNLSGLSGLYMGMNKMCRMPSVVAMMPQLAMYHLIGVGNKKVSGKQEKEGLHRVEGILTHSLCSSKLKLLSLEKCELSDGFFPLAVAWFPNLTELYLSGSNFTILPECIQEFRFLETLNVNDCEHLREIRGSPPCLRNFSALNCKTLSPMGTSVILNQEPHQNGRLKWFWYVMRGRFPRWFEQRGRGASISFWFRGNHFPRDALLVAIRVTDDFHCNPIQVTPVVTINGKEFPDYLWLTHMEQLFVFDLSRFHYDDRGALLFENEWNHAKVSYKAQQLSKGTYDDEYHDVQIESIAKEIGMHILKQKRSRTMQDIRFTDPYKMRELIIMMMMVSMVLPNHKKQPLLRETRIGLWTLLFLTHTALGNNTLS